MPEVLAEILGRGSRRNFVREDTAMTEDFWSSWFAFALLAGPILLCFVSLAFSLYLSRRHLDAMLEALKGSRYLAVWAAGLRGHGWFGRFMLTAKVSGMVTWPGPGIRAGELDPTRFGTSLRI